MESNYYGALLERHLFGKADESLVHHILEYEDANGGFKDFCGGAGHIESTFFALDILRKENLLEQVSAKKHTAWIIDQLKERKGSSSKSEAILEDLYYCVRSLEILDREKLRTITFHEDDISYVWDTCDKTFKHFCYASKILASICPSKNATLEKFRALWLDVFWKSILTIDFRGNLKDVAFFILSVESLGPENMSEILESLKELVAQVKFLR
jgi:hypothetical protein